MYVVEDKNDSLKIKSSDTLLRVSPIFSAVILDRLQLTRQKN